MARAIFPESMTRARAAVAGTTPAFLSDSRSTAPRVAEVRLNELALVEGGAVDLESLKKAGVVPQNALRAKVVLSGTIATAVSVKGVGVTKGARAAIEAAGGTVESA